MRYKEYGADRAETIILLHGGGLSWWNYREEAELLCAKYRVILPILDGHAGSDRHFSGIEENAAEILSFIDEHLCGRVLLIGGLSLGAQILLELLSRRADVCRCAVVESAAVIPSALTNALIAPAFGSSYGLIKNRAFASLQFASLHIRQELFADYYRDTCLIEKADMIAFLKASTSYSLKSAVSLTSASVHVFAGGRENREILRSAELIRRAIPGCRKTILPDLYHGGFSLNEPDRYVRSLEDILGG